MSADRAPTGGGYVDTYDFADVLAREGDDIAARKEKHGRTGSGTTGIALSGGGIRSTAVCLGALQALHAYAPSGRDLKGVDYLSTVSGGGYVGCALTAAMQKSERFPFTSAGEPGREDEFCDTGAVRHIRDFSNYLFPRGGRDVIPTLGLIARGLAANLVLLMPWLLALAMINTLLTWRPEWLSGDAPTLRILARLCPWLVDYLRDVQISATFPLTTLATGVSLGVLILWALFKTAATSAVASRVLPSANKATGEFNGFFAICWYWLFIISVCLVFLELQPQMMRLLSAEASGGACLWHAGETCPQWILHLWLGATPYLAPLGAVFTFFSRELLRLSKRTSRRKTRLSALLAPAALWFAALVIPSFLWFVALTIARWSLEAANDSGSIIVGAPHAAELLGFGFLGFLVIALCINPNVTSLHRLYRDRLGKAFLFNPQKRDRRDDLESFEPKIHEITNSASPYLIVNAAINLEGSPFANRRGRNADFFIFTPNYIGSDATRYVDSERMQAQEQRLDLAAAMAISGAAVSPNMGSATIKALVPTLALLNIRLGYWLRNPRFIKSQPGMIKSIFDIRSLLLFKEVFSRIDENSKTVYLTDGGNLENLGIYSLLKRKCSVIIAVDAEADPDMRFGSLLTLERYARIDLGVIIDVPYHEIRTRTFAVNDTVNAGAPCHPAKGPHCAICDIRYGSDPSKNGVLVYFKSSMTGDEDDYVLDYKRRHPAFPHEATSDQFFGEEQFEAYRSLGFHMVQGAFNGDAQVAIRPPIGVTAAAARAALMKRVVETMKSEESTPPA